MLPIGVPELEGLVERGEGGVEVSPSHGGEAFVTRRVRCDLTLDLRLALIANTLRFERR